ncbi:hypothetical protein ACFVS2_06475 [Brevibacillus sp. NPDC058079]|uniref:hypothetical protein n=1 Tax=Brevibacillus sp. NPDC058079 TaxID=3346330 RepID=UPI0036E4E28D
MKEIQGNEPAKIGKLDNETLQEIVKFQQHAAKLLQVKLDDQPHDIVKVITEWVRELKSNKQTLENDDCIALGVLLGEQYVRAFSWHWGTVNDSSAAVLNADNSIAIQPIFWVDEVVTNREGTNFMLNFNMVADGNMPICPPNTAMWFH